MKKAEKMLIFQSRGENVGDLREALKRADIFWDYRWALDGVCFLTHLELSIFYRDLNNDNKILEIDLSKLPKSYVSDLSAFAGAIGALDATIKALNIN
jgi:hypothetical protein